MVRRRAHRESLDAMRAEYLVCLQLSRACRQAMAEIALDDGNDPGVRRRAVQLLKEILVDWSDAQGWLRADISRRQRGSSLTPR